MYISSVSIENFRCFENTTVEFRPGINVIIGENNAGKTALLAALGLIFKQGGRRRPRLHDFFQGISDLKSPPVISVSAKLSSSSKDTVVDKSLVATWLTKVDAPWQASLTYRCFLPEKEAQDFRNEVGSAPTKEVFWRAVERFLPKYVTRIYGGNPVDLIQVESESLGRFDFQFVDALRDVQTEMFSGQDPLLKEMLHQVMDIGAGTEGIQEQRSKFESLITEVHNHIVGRLDLNRLFQLIDHTGAGDGGKLDVEGKVAEAELLSALRLIVHQEGLRLPVIANGLGYNNLVYISLLLAKMDYASSVERKGENAAVFPMLVVEEPEAHLHPALQYKLLRYLRQRIEGGESKSRQVFITTHSTHITSACRLDDVICLSASEGGKTPLVSYPGKVFADSVDGQASKKYIERFLDATKSNLLFSKSVILVEGLAEQLVIPMLAEYCDLSLEDYHVALVRVDGSTFKHFLPLFGGGEPSLRTFALSKRLACIVDADPARQSDTEKKYWKSCWPFQNSTNSPGFMYRYETSVISNLRNASIGITNINIYRGKKTFEYDLAEVNRTDLLITDSCSNASSLKSICSGGDVSVLAHLLDSDASQALSSINDKDQLEKVRFAAYYLICVEDAKGEHAFDLSCALREDLAKGEKDRTQIVVPSHIASAIEFVCGITKPALVGGEADDTAI